MLKDSFPQCLAVNINIFLLVHRLQLLVALTFVPLTYLFG